MDAAIMFSGALKSLTLNSVCTTFLHELLQSLESTPNLTDVTLNNAFRKIGPPGQQLRTINLPHLEALTITDDIPLFIALFTRIVHPTTVDIEFFENPLPYADPVPPDRPEGIRTIGTLITAHVTTVRSL
ncbi:hypothetical protein DXG01_002928 [Tephrocybe rancida]|nr:hypothetical protein DXG01_002928 [Tephrocybe rancida]